MKIRAEFREMGADFLRANGVPFVVRMDGAHLIVEGPNGHIDYWPGGGKWHDKTTGKWGCGMKQLGEHLGIKNLACKE